MHQQAPQFTQPSACRKVPSGLKGYLLVPLRLESDPQHSSSLAQMVRHAPGRLLHGGVELDLAVRASLALGDFMHEEIRHNRMPRRMASLVGMKQAAHRVFSKICSMVR